MTLADELVAYACDLTYAALPEAVVAQTKRVVLDTVGCALGGARSEPARIAAALAGEVRAVRPATVMVSGLQTSPDLAAFVNGILVRYQDYNDTYLRHGLCHPSDMFAAVLAATQVAGGSGRDLILGMALAYEVFCGMVDANAQATGALGRSGGGGFDQATFGVMGAAVAAARLLGLDRAQITHALSMAVASHITLSNVRQGHLSHWKGAAVPNAGRNGVVCALLAAHGLTGPEDVFAGPGGFFTVAGAPLASPPLGGRDGDYRMLSTIMKPVPAGYMCATAVEAAAQARAQIPDFRVADVQAVRLHTYRVGMAYAGDFAWQPRTRETADHSLPYVVAMTVIDGELTLDQYERGRYLDADVRDLMRRTTVDVSDAATAVYPDQSLNTVEIELRSGVVYRGQVAYQAGHPKRPFTAEEQERKFRSMAEGIAGLGAGQTAALLDTLRRLDGLERVDDLIALTVPAA